MINKKWGDRFELALYWTISMLWIIAGIFFTYYYHHTQEGIEVVIASGQHKYSPICFAIGLGTSPLVSVNYFVKFFIFGLGIVAIEAGLI
jgi:hypothetical protein